MHVICVHSFRGGTGKSTITANLAAMAAMEGRRVGVVDTDIQSPGIHVLFGLSGRDDTASLNDYLYGTVHIEDVALDVTPAGSAGSIHLVPASMRPGEITRVAREGYDARRLVTGLRAVADAHRLDVLFIDTHPGLGEETLLALVLADTVVVVMRPDQQDHDGTAIVLDVAAGLEVPTIRLVVNQVPVALDTEQVRRAAATAFGRRVTAVLHRDDRIALLRSQGLVAREMPDHAFTGGLHDVLRELLPGNGAP